MKNVVVFEPKYWLKDDIYWLLKSSCFELFDDGKYGLFLSQEDDGKMIFTGYWKVLVLNFSMMGNTVFFKSRRWWKRWYLLATEKFLFWTFRWWEIRSFLSQEGDGKDDIYWLLKSSCFELFGGGKYGLFLSQEVDGKIIFTWSFWAFHNIPGPGKYGFSCSVWVVTSCMVFTCKSQLNLVILVVAKQTHCFSYFSFFWFVGNGLCRVRRTFWTLLLYSLYQSFVIIYHWSFRSNLCDKMHYLMSVFVWFPYHDQSWINQKLWGWVE